MMFYQQTGIKLGHRWDYDNNDVKSRKQQIEEFIFYRKKFEKSQRAKAAISGKSEAQKFLEGKLEQVDLDEDMFDPRKMQQHIEQDRANKRGKKLDESVKLKICDLGNGCWTHYHFSSTIQTRQYRSPEVIIGAEYNTTADIWSLGCMLFEMATGDVLFQPRNSSNKKYTEDDDHIAQMIELLGPIPKSVALQGKKFRKMFDKTNQLRNLKGLNYWPLHRVLHEKYKFKLEDAVEFAEFLHPMLCWDPEKRASAQHLLDHPWFKAEASYDTRMTKDEIEKMYVQLEDNRKFNKPHDDIFFNETEVKIENSVLVASDAECHEGDDELSTMSMSDDGGFFSSDDEPCKPQKKHPAWRKADEPIYLKRDIAEGCTFNNSFTGPYPEETDHLHIDKGPNPQFGFLRNLK